jgi:hypothetical protein
MNDVFIFKNIIYQVRPEVDEIAIFGEEKSKFNLLTCDKLYNIIIL